VFKDTPCGKSVICPKANILSGGRAQTTAMILRKAGAKTFY
jgi:hypothetical protein